MEEISKSKVLMWITIVEVIGHSFLLVVGSPDAEWHLLGWLLCMLTLISFRIYFNLKTKNKTWKLKTH